MNLSDRTRRQQIIDYLTERKGQWVNGNELATAEVGGSEGLRRLREIRGEYMIEQRRHPAYDKDVWQYRMVDKPDVSPIRADAPKKSTPKAPEKPTEPHPTRMQFGLSKYCDICKGRGVKGGDRCKVCDGYGWL